MLVDAGSNLLLLSESRKIRRIDARCICKVLSNDRSFQRTSLDSHADTSCAGSNTEVLELTGEKVNVYPFSDDLPAVEEVPIATVLTAWECPETGDVWMLVIHEALYFGDRLTESLLCPNQLRAAGNIVNDVPKQFDARSSHSIVIPNKLTIPLDMHGVISHLHTRKPTAGEIERYQEGLLQSVELTANTPWEPYSSKFAADELAARSARFVAAPRVTFPRVPDSNSGFREEEAEDNPRRPPILDHRSIAVATRLECSNFSIELSEDEELATRLIAAVNVGADETGDEFEPKETACTCEAARREVRTFKTANKGPILTKEILAKCWGIGR